MNRECNDDCDRATDPTLKCAACNVSCHISCYGINKTALRVIGEVQNLWFLCDECNDKKKAFITTHDDVDTNNVNTADVNTDSASIFQAIGELKNMVIDMQLKINKIEKPSYSNVLADGIFKPNVNHGSAKRKRMRYGDNVFNNNNMETP